MAQPPPADACPSGPGGTSRRRARALATGAVLLALVFLLMLAILPRCRWAQGCDPDGSRDLKAKDTVHILAEGLDSHRRAHGTCPEAATWEALVDKASPLVREGRIPATMPCVDPWGRPYRGLSGPAGYRLEILGDPRHPDTYPPRVLVGGTGHGRPAWEDPRPEPSF